MADFCYKCVQDNFEVPGNMNDMRGICEPGYAASAVCEGCGPGWFDHDGKRIEAQPEQQEQP